MDKVQLIVARYRECTRQLHAFCGHLPLVIYDKFDPLAEHPLPNLPRFDCRAFGGAQHAKSPTGREGHTYLYHILKHYPHFPPHLVFLQGGVNDHSSSTLLRIRELARADFPECDYLPLGWPIDLNGRDGGPAHFGLPIERIYRRLFRSPCPDYFLFCCAALFVVSKERILARPRTFYEEAMQSIYDEPLAGYALERLWGVIFNPHIAAHKARYPAKDASLWQLPGLAQSASRRML